MAGAPRPATAARELVYTTRFTLSLRLTESTTFRVPAMPPS